jgi:c(7)-type cytochrome triheme protein
MRKQRIIPFILVLSIFAISSVWWAPRAGAGKLPMTSSIAGDKLGRRYADIYKEEDRTRLIKHSHKFHAAKSAECTECHASVEKSTLASDNNLGKMAECYECHDKETTECSVCHVEPKEPYSVFANPKRELIFNHQQHVTDLKIECETCHGDINKKEYANARVLPPMESCSTCHNGIKASDNCQVCHTDIRFIRPADHELGFLRTHKQIVAASSDANCLMCHTQSSCQECHEGGHASKTAKGNEFESSRAGSSLGTGAGQIVQNVHSLDYLVTHRFDFKAKSQECQSCHEPETFCVDCHSGSGKASRPAWHDVAGFTSGTGGLHASMAKKDMESCVVCHASSQNDVTCVQCHTSKGGLR